MSIRFDNIAEPAGEQAGKPYFRWEVFVDAPASTLAEIAEVQYILHPTVREPVRTVRDRSSNFAIRSAGWGEFNIVARVRFLDGHTEDFWYRLDLAKRRQSAVAAG